MPEAKNTFIQSKMNKDMDGRILPNGQYRDGQNIQISRSEGEDVGALENVLGNEFISNFGLTEENLEIIGYLANDNLNSLFLFITNYTDSSANTLNHNASGIAGSHYIVQYNTLDNTSKILVEGSFLNFSKTHPIIGINLLEELLFWTDNRNQPRKINITKAVGNYYTNEDQISVSKYYPYEPISLLEDVGGLPQYQSSMKDKVSEYLPIHAAAKVDTVAGNVVTLVGIYTNIKPGIAGDLMTGQAVQGENSVVSALSFGASTTDVTVNGGVADLNADDIVYFQRKNPFANINWPGDKQFFKDKFARFSYRFRYVDGEYSLSAPFTQLAFVPEQDGYFIGDNAQVSNSDNNVGGLVGDEGSAINSTIVSFMRNKINDVGLYIPAPTIGNSSTSVNWSEVNTKLHIEEVDILYKEAQSNKTTIIDTITLNQFNAINDKYYYYNYQSRKPWKTLPPSQTTRVSESTPVRAFSQEISGNRVMYGNYIDKHTSPINLNYTVNVNEKPALPTIPSNPNYGDRDYYVRKEYQNHTLKGNRTYQVGIVLYDRYGRQSNVILSNVLNPNIPDFNGSTFFHPYRRKEDYILLDKYGTDAFGNPPIDPKTWPGDQINLIFFDIIPKLKTSNGYPGVYSEADGTVVNLTASNINTITPVPGVFTPPCSFTNVTFNGKLGTMTGTCDVEFNAAGVVTSIIVTSSTNAWSNGDTFTLDFCGLPAIPGCDACAAETNPISGIVETSISNPLGWYSYKVVIKQTEQDYYNVYLPTTLAGYPCDVTGIPAQVGDPDATDPEFSTPEIPEFTYPKGISDSTSHVVLFGDNINKITRDLQDVTPVQEKYRSSVKLYGRVNNILQDNGQATLAVSNEGYDPSLNADVAVQVATMENLGLGDLRTSPSVPIIPNIIYKGETNPQIARVETNAQFGVAYNNCTPNPAFSIPVIDIADIVPPNTASQPWGTTVSVYETAPVESLLDIFWESTTSGLVKDLNFNIENNDNTIPVGITDPQISWSEADKWGDQISGTFEAAGVGGQGLGGTCTITLNSVTRGDGTPQNQIILVETGPGTGEYYLQIDPALEAVFSPLFLCYEDSLKNIFYFNFTITRDNGIDPVTSINIEAQGIVDNAIPIRRADLIGTELMPNGDVNECGYKNQSFTTIKDNMNARWDDPTIPLESLPISTTLFMPQYGNGYMLNIPCDNGTANTDPSPGPSEAVGTATWNGDASFLGTNKCQIYDLPLNSRVGFGKIMAAQPILNSACVSTGFTNAKWAAMMGYDLHNDFILPGPAYYGTAASQVPGFFGPPAGLYNSLVGFNPQNQNVAAISLYNASDRLLGAPANMPFWANAPLNGGMDCCDKSNGIATQVGGSALAAINYFQPGWQRYGTGIHDGKFAAYNGLYGSKPTDTFPPGGNASVGRASEMVFSIPRMYQVSMYMNWWSLQQNMFGGGIGQQNRFNFTNATPYNSTFEYIFGLNPFTSDVFPPVSNPSPIFPKEQNISTLISPISYIWGDPSVGGTTNFNNNPCYPAGNYDEALCQALRKLPTSPIYWDHESGQRPGSQGSSQTLFQQGGESYVGERYNNGRWYWSDYDALMENIYDSDWAGINGWTSYDDMMQKVFPIQHGSNTFYAGWQGDWRGEVGTSPNPKENPSPGGNTMGVPNNGRAADWAFWRQQPTTDKDFTAYLGGLDANGIGDPFNKRFRFNPITENVPLTAGSGYQQPLRGWVEAGDRNAGSGTAVAWDVLSNGITDWLVGNGMPGGRYVVTLRCTDRSIKIPGQESIPNPDGLFVEWDIPIIVPEWRIPVGSWLSCYFVNSGGYAAGNSGRWHGDKSCFAGGP